MAKQLNVSLGFTADTSQARKQLQDLQNQLTNLMNSTMKANATSGLGITKDISNATSAAARLKVQLEQATNVNTGKLDLTKFNDSLKKSGMSLEKYREELSKLGPAGNQAFLSLAQSISNAEVPLRRTNAMLDEFVTTMKNTARWQISSSIMHGFMGTLHSAYGYAQDLNESLNNIRIVTSQSVDQMDKFAAKANKAAKALNATTLEYTNASLIYYQQGLNDNEVEERTDVTVKMANVARISSETASDQLTAIWNNFDDGTKSLEHYADVLVRLGADTASSSDEISQGMEKFAAVADSIGLSYENAAAALATVTATTRQSADVVGTAFKTIFARIQGLNLGETLDDGTDLNKYSKALDAVGISIKDQNGELRNMDSILNDMGSKWGSLNKDQQVALAQTVAGVRQYTQLVALMDNWDFYQQNLLSAQNADGALQEQADIYAESWEAAQDRVRAAAEKIYSSLLNDDFFIDLLDGFEKVLTGLGAFIDGLGGVKGVLLALSAVATKVFQVQIAKGLENMAHNVKMLKPGAYEEEMNTKIEAWEESAKLNFSTGTTEGAQQSDNVHQTAELQRSLLENSKLMSEEELKRCQIMMDSHEILQKQSVEEAKKLDTIQQETSELSKKALIESGVAGSKDEDKRKKYSEARKELKKEADTFAATKKEIDRYEKALRATGSSSKKFAKELNNIAKTPGVSDEIAESLNKLQSKFESGEISVEQFAQELEELYAISRKKWGDNVEKFAEQTGVTQETAESLGGSLVRLKNQTDAYDNSTKNATENTNRLKEQIKNAGKDSIHYSQSLVACAQTISTVGMVLSSVSGLIDTLSDPDISGFEKIIAVMSTLGMVIPMVTMAFSKNNLAQMSSVASSIAAALGFKGVTIAVTEEGVMTNVATKETIGFGAALWTVLWPIGLVMAAIAALVGVVVLLVNAWNADANAAKEANKNLEEATKNAEEAKNKYDELCDSLQNLADAEQTLQDLADDTEAWKNKITELNNEVLNLLDTYPELAQYITPTEDGLLKVSKKGLQMVSDKAYTAQQNAYQQKLQAQWEASNAQLKSDTTDLKRDVTYQQTYQTPNGPQTQTFQISDSQLKSVYDALDEHGNAIFENSETLSKATGITNTSLLNSIMSSRDEIMKLKSSVDANTVANDLLTQQYAKSFLDTNLYEAAGEGTFREYAGMSTQRQQQVANLVNRNASEDNEENKEIADKYDSGVFGWSGLGRHNKSDDKIHEEYAEKMGYDTSSIEDGNGKGTFSTGSGSVTVSDDEMRAYLEQQEKMENAAKKAQGYIDTINNLYAQGIQAADNLGIENAELANEVGEMMASFYGGNGDLTTATLEQITALQSVIDGAVDPTSIISNEEAQKAGYDSASAYVDAMQQKLNEWDPEVSAILNAEEEEAKWNSALEQTAEELDVSKNALKAYTSFLQSNNGALKVNRQAALQAAKAAFSFSKGVDKLGSALDDNWQLLEDWKNGLTDSTEAYEAVGQVQEALEAMFGVEVSANFVNEHLEELKDLANGDTEALKELQRAAVEDYVVNLNLNEETYNQIQDIISQIDSADCEIGASINTENVIGGLNEILASGQMTADEIQTMLNGLGYNPDIKYKTQDGPETTSTTNGEVQVLGHTVGSFTATTTSKSQVKVPYIAGEGTYDASTGAVNGSGLTRTSDVSTLTTAVKNDGESGEKVDDSSGGKEKKDKEKFDKEDSQEKNIEDETDRYHEIKNELESIERELDKIGKAKDRAFGKDKLKLMDQEAKALEKQIALQKQYLSEIEANLKKDSAALSKYGAQINENGNITNYDEMVAAKVAEYNSAYDAYINAKNAAVNAYNNSSKDESADTAYDNAIEAADKAWEKAKERYSDFKDEISQYEDTVDLFEESQQTLIDMQNQLYDLALEKVQYVVELKVNVAEDSLEYINYLLDKMDDSAYDAAESIALLGQSVDQSMKKIKAYQDGLKGIFENHGLSESDINKFLSGDEATIEKISQMSFTEDEIAAMRDYRSALLEENSTLMELRETVRAKVLSAFEELSSEFDKQTSKIEHLQSVTQSYQNIIDIIGQDYLGITDELMGALNQSTVDTAINKLSASKSKLDAMKDSRARAQEELDKAQEQGLTDLAEYWQDTLDEMDEQISEAEEEFMSSWEDALQSAADAFEKTITSVVENFTDKMAGAAGSITKLQDQFDKQKEESERYLADYKQSYELAKLARDITKSIDDTDNIKAKQDYKELLEEIQDIEETGVELSEYDLQQLQKKYELKQAELALEEAKNSKSQVRMTRDNEGNWGYVYTADEDKISAAIQAYEDKAYEIQELADQHSKEMQESLISTVQAMADEIQNIQATYGTDEWYEEVERITAYYQEKFDYHSEQLNHALEDLGISFNDTALASLTGFTSMEGYQRALNNAIGNPTQKGTLLGDLDLAYQTWKANTERAMNEAGTSTDKFGQQVEQTVATVEEESQNAADAAERMGETMVGTMDEIIDSVANWEENYSSAIDDMIAKNEALIESFNQLLAKQSEVEGTRSSGSGSGSGRGSGSGSGSGSGGGSGSSGDSGGGSGSGSGDGNNGGKFISEPAHWDSSGAGDKSHPTAATNGIFYLVDTAPGSKYPYGIAKKPGWSRYGWVSSFDTGGYTGSWGVEGRLAMLHQKEIVLNARDTENLLSAVEMIRDISNAIDLNALTASHGLNSLLSVSTIKDHDEVLQQEVTIHAEFPNVQNHNEIEEAFNNLVNAASQYAYRK